jgi:hypothetical protein
MVRRRLVAVAAYILWNALALSVAYIAGGPLVGAGERHRVEFRRQGSILEARRSVAVLAHWAKVGVARRLVAVGTFVGQVHVGSVAIGAGQGSMRPFQGYRVLEIA